MTPLSTPKPQAPAEREHPRFRDLKMPLEQRVEDLISRLSVQEKLGQLQWNSPAIGRLGIDAYNWWNECLHGVGRAGIATVFPQAIGLAATFDDELIYKVATAISDEARAKHHAAARNGNHGQYFGLTFWSPNINILRDPRWGRGQETYGEDPCLTARMATAFVRGLQGEDSEYIKVVATPKHFAVHSGPESDRHHIDVRPSAHDFEATYLPAFRAVVIDAGAHSIMGAYNRLYGEPCCGSPRLLHDLLRLEWRFDGCVVADYGAIRDFHATHRVTRDASESVALALRSGCDLNVGTNDCQAVLEAAYQRGLIDDELIDRALTRVLTLRFQLGLFDPESKVPYSRIPLSAVNDAGKQALAHKTAIESMVLLKNNGILPLSRDIQNIAVVGPAAYDTRVLHGNYTGYAPRVVTFLEGILGKVSPAVQVNYAMGCDYTGSRPIEKGVMDWWIKDAEAIVAILGNNSDLEGEEADDGAQAGLGGDRASLDLPGRQQELLEYLQASGRPVILVLTGGSALTVNWAAEHVAAIVMAWYPGERGGSALGDILFGDENPSGRLPVTFYRSTNELPSFSDYSMRGRTYRYMNHEPLFPFGFGLSYSVFNYSNLELSGTELGSKATIRASVLVGNISDRSGSEVVQVYVRPEVVEAGMPGFELRMFRRVNVEAGKKVRVEFILGASTFARVSAGGILALVPGRYQIYIGGSQPGQRSLELGAPAGVTGGITIVDKADSS